MERHEQRTVELPLALVRLLKVARLALRLARRQVPVRRVEAALARAVGIRLHPSASHRIEYQPVVRHLVRERAKRQEVVVGVLF